MTSLELSKNKYVQGLLGEEGAEKLAEVSDKHKRKPNLYGFKSVDENLTRVSALGSTWDFGSGLDVDGYSLGDDRYGYALGVSNKNFSSGNKQVY